MIDVIKVYGYNVRIIESGGRQSFKIVIKIDDPKVTKETMTKIYKYLIFEGFIINPRFPI